jgi:hypothetical protein
MPMYSGKERKCVPPSMTTTDETITILTVRTENVGHKLYMDSSFLQLFDDLHTETVRSDRQLMPKRIGQKMKLKQGSTEIRVEVT